MMDKTKVDKIVSLFNEILKVQDTIVGFEEPDRVVKCRCTAEYYRDIADKYDEIADLYMEITK